MLTLTATIVVFDSRLVRNSTEILQHDGSSANLQHTIYSCNRTVDVCESKKMNTQLQAVVCAYAIRLKQI